MAVESWSFDLVHSSLGFWIRHLMISRVHGRFARWTGTLAFDEQDPSKSKVEVEIDAASIDTKEPQRDTHLRSADFFEVEKYPHITFKSTAVRPGDDGRFEIDGDLTMHGVTRPVVLHAEYAGRTKHPQMGERIGFSAHVSVSRKDFGLTYNMVLEAGGVALGDKIEVSIDIEAVKA
jgi:polyisoprenoid-binding protein YceI